MASMVAGGAAPASRRAGLPNGRSGGAPMGRAQRIGDGAPVTAPPPLGGNRRLILVGVVSGPLLVLVAVLAAVVSPGVMAGDESATGRDLWIGAAVGVVEFALVIALPPVLFALALRSGGRRRLFATAAAAPLWALGTAFLPLVSALAGGFEGVSAIAVVAAALAGVLDVALGVAAWRIARPGSGLAPPAEGTPDPPA